jgi:soluble lytic murein transglycosylase-like protein
MGLERPAGEKFRRLFRAAVAAAWVLAAIGFGLRSPAGAFCFDEAARKYNLPPLLLRTIAQEESGLDPNAAGWNADGSVDVGLMQINSWWEEKLGRARWIGLCSDPCYNVMVGAWILADCIYRYGYTVDGIGCYNASSPKKRAKYTDKILKRVLGLQNKAQGK